MTMLSSHLLPRVSLPHSRRRWSFGMTVRDAVEGDLPAILEIYNDVIATSTAVYRDTPATLDDRLAWWRAKLEPGYPTLVADDNGVVIGFATFGDFRSWPGYRFTVEHTGQRRPHLWR